MRLDSNLENAEKVRVLNYCLEIILESNPEGIDITHSYTYYNQDTEEFILLSPEDPGSGIMAMDYKITLPFVYKDRQAKMSYSGDCLVRFASE